MDSFEFYRPTSYHFGAGLENDVGRLIKRCKKQRVLVVYGTGSCVVSGLLSRVEASLKHAGVDYICKGGVVPNPRADLVYEMINLGRREHVDFILAVGGGSVIDTAKATAIGIVNDCDFFDFFLHKMVPRKALEVGVILTLPAAGSEGSSSAVIQKMIDGRYHKCGLSSILNVPRFAIMNPELTMTLPPFQTACGAVDMMAHVMERYFTNSVDVSITDRICEAIMTSIIETIPRVLRDPHNYEARANLMWASTMAHNDICGVGREQDWATHALEHQMSAFYDVTHGAGLAVLFPAWMEYTVDHNPMRFAQFANRVFGIPVDFEDPKRTARSGIDALRSFYKMIGMPLSFAELGANAEDIPQLLKLLEVDKHTIGHFVQLNRDDCESIYRIAAQYDPSKSLASQDKKKPVF